MTRATPTRRRLVALALACAVLSSSACDDGGGGEPSQEQRRCDVLFQLQLRLGARVVSPAPAAMSLGAYAIENGERVLAPGSSACVTTLAGQLDAACDTCTEAPASCEPLVRTIFAHPHESCSACGDGVCLEGESPGNCPEDCTESCGDGVCGQLENELGCAQDCAVACGDSVCAAGEDPGSCPQDCNYAVGNGLCEPGETPTNSAADCQGATCGDGYCQSYESTLLCAVDCCTATICNAPGDVCTGSHAIARCEPRGLGNCPELLEPRACELGCAWLEDGVQAACVTCQDLVERAGLASDTVHGTTCSPEVDRCLRLEQVHGHLGVEGPRNLEDHVVDCEALPALAPCTVARTSEVCAVGTACLDGACVDCLAPAQASGQYDLAGGDYVFGCVPGAAVCARALDPAAPGASRDVVVDCEPVAGHPSCTIGRVLEVCQGGLAADEAVAWCFEGVCDNCTGAARGKGYDLDGSEYVFGCERGASGCLRGRSTARPEDGDHLYFVGTCESVEGALSCTLAPVLEDCGPADDPGTACTDTGCGP